MRLKLQILCSVEQFVNLTMANTTLFYRISVSRLLNARIDWFSREVGPHPIVNFSGNAPVRGGKLMRKSLGDAYVDRLFSGFAGRVPAEADLVCYWFAKAWERLCSLPTPGGGEGRLRRVGLVATNSIRGGASRRVLDRIARDGQIFDAGDDEPWVIEGVAVRVSLICFSAGRKEERSLLDGKPVERIGSDLAASRSDLTTARRLIENRGIAFMGDTKGGAFDVPGELARQWLRLPLNPNGRPNSDVLRPWMNGMDVTRRPSGRWVIDFGWEMSERETALYEAPFAYCLANMKPKREKLRRHAYRLFWWRHVEPRPGMWRALRDLPRFLVTPGREASIVHVDCSGKGPGFTAFCFRP
jgi:type II restriction/modification system DNA methylase subunit YeeA